MNIIYIAFIFLLLYGVMAYYFKTSDDYDTLIVIRKGFKYVFPIIIIIIILVSSPTIISKGTSSVIHFIGVLLLFSPFMIIGYNIFMWRWGLRDFYDESHIENMEFFALYLRSFKDDDHNKYYSQNVIKTINKLFCPFAVGRPYELLPPRIGAPRLYLGDDWKENVQYLMEKAQIIILRINETENFIWEYKQVLLNNFIHKTIFWIKDSDSLKDFLSKLDENYSIIWDKMQVDAIGEESLAFINGDEWLCFANNQGSAFLSSFKKTHTKMINENKDYLYNNEGLFRHLKNLIRIHDDKNLMPGIPKWDWIPFLFPVLYVLIHRIEKIDTLFLLSLVDIYSIAPFVAYKESPSILAFLLLLFLLLPRFLVMFFMGRNARAAVWLSEKWEGVSYFNMIYKENNRKVLLLAVSVLVGFFLLFVYR